MYHIPFLLGSHEECSGNDLIRWYPCVPFLSYLTSGRNHLGYGREEISKSQDVPRMLPGSCWKTIWWKQSLHWSPLVCLSSLFSSLWPTVHLPYPNLLGSLFYFFGLLSAHPNRLLLSLATSQINAAWFSSPLAFYSLSGKDLCPNPNSTSSVWIDSFCIFKLDIIDSSSSW